MLDDTASTTEQDGEDGERYKKNMNENKHENMNENTYKTQE